MLFIGIDNHKLMRIFISCIIKLLFTMNPPTAPQYYYYPLLQQNHWSQYPFIYCTVPSELYQGGVSSTLEDKLIEAQKAA